MTDAGRSMPGMRWLVDFDEAERNRQWRCA